MSALSLQYWTTVVGFVSLLIVLIGLSNKLEGRLMKIETILGPEGWIQTKFKSVDDDMEQGRASPAHHHARARPQVASQTSGT